MRTYKNIFPKSVLIILLFSSLCYSQQWELYKLTDNEGAFVSSMVEDNDQNMWFGVRNYGLVKFEADTIIVIDSTQWSKDWIIALEVDKQNNLWIATVDEGLIKFDGNTFTYFDMLQIAPNSASNSAWDVKLDSDDNIWVGTYWAGLAKYNGVTWTIYDNTNSPIHPLQMEVNVIAFDNFENLWFGSDMGGMGSFDRINQWNIFYNLGSWIGSIIVDKNNVVWVSEARFFGRVENGFVTRFPIKVCHTNYGIAVAQNNKKLIGMEYSYGIIVYDEIEFSEVYPPFQELTASITMSLYIDSRNNTWIGYNDGSIVKYTGDFTTNIADEEIKTPKDFALEQNYPNPFNPTTKIRFSIPKEDNVKIVITNSLGQQVAELLNTRLEAGRHELNFNAGNYSSGVYFYQIQAGEYSEVRKMMLLK